MGSHVANLLSHRLWRPFVAAAAVLLLYSAAGFLFFPAIVRKSAAREWTEFLGRAVTIQRIDFNPFAMTFAVHGLRIDEPKGGALLSWDVLNISLAPVASLLHHAWVFRDAFLREPRVTVVRDARGEMNLSDLARLDWKALNCEVGIMRLADGEIIVRDEAVPGGFSTTIGRLTATLKDFSTNPGHDNLFSISAASETGERLSWNGLVRMDPLSSRGQIAVDNVQIGTYLPYLAERFNVTTVEGTLTARTGYEMDIAPDRLKVLLFDGAIDIDSFLVREHGNAAPLLGFAKLALAGARVDLVNHTVGVDSILVTGGSAVIQRLSDNTLNLQHLVKTARPHSVTKATRSVNWKVTVAEIALHDGQLLFTDFSLTPPMRLALTAVDIRAGGISSASPRVARVAIHAAVNDGGTLQVFGETNPIRAQGEMNVRGLLQNVNLVPFSAYAAKYLGYVLTAGSLNMEIRSVMRGRKLDIQDSVAIDGLAFGRWSKSADAAKFPVLLTIALLKDWDGRITLRVPIALALDDPGFELQKRLITGVLHPFIKTAAFRFAALGAQLGGGGDELGFQEFAADSADLVPRETEKLDTILKGLKRWPEFMLDVEGSVDLENDTGDLLLLAAGRAEKVKEYLLRQGALEPDRIFLIDNSLDNVPRKGSRALLYLKDKYHGPDPAPPSARLPDALSSRLKHDIERPGR